MVCLPPSVDVRKGRIHLMYSAIREPATHSEGTPQVPSLALLPFFSFFNHFAAGMMKFSVPAPKEGHSF